ILFVGNSCAMPDYIRLPIGANSPNHINAVIEIPKNSTNKYEYDRHLGVFRLDRILHSPVLYPGDYGFIPSTLGMAGDPRDVIVDGHRRFNGPHGTPMPAGVSDGP